MLIHESLVAAMLIHGSLAAAVGYRAPPDAVKLFAASYSGKITTLSLEQQGYGSSLKSLFTNADSAPSPSWLLLDGKLLYSVDEGLNVPNGSVNVFEVGDDGSLKRTSRVGTIDGGVNGAFYADGAALVVPHYAGSAVTTYLIDKSSKSVTRHQNFTFTLPAKGPNPDRQEAPHPHQAIVHPSGNFILVPDLGADLVRVFRVDKNSKDITEVDPLKAAPGSGPRHAAFGTGKMHKRDERDDKDHSEDEHELFLYLVAELANTVTVYKTTCLPGETGLKFEQVQVASTYADKQPPNGTAAAEIALSASGTQVIISNRGDNGFSTAGKQSDSFATYSIDTAKGSLSPIGLFPAGGPFPRQFALNKAGDLVAVGLQKSGDVAVFKFDKEKGKFGDKVASINVGGEVVCVIWDE
ncbi:hypothetical protein GP486_002119 [Trichoglossum hirsutum]|uniref:6-phosphogluconolactonase n=1 Tax=Trichoglossum hirsutum TaxID=265104 RepID=A0A9P8LFP1_9PEZI|nr:hypothetical protein GP486_002119 [Trichoglossum hirsutum]